MIRLAELLGAFYAGMACMALLVAAGRSSGDSDH